MADKLPPITDNRNLDKGLKPSSSLIGRGLSAIQKQKISTSELDAIYREAREIYDRMTAYGWKSSSDDADEFKKVFKVFQNCADKGYGKAYYPLARMYFGCPGVSRNKDKALYYSQLAFDWCFAEKSKQ